MDSLQAPALASSRAVRRLDVDFARSQFPALAGDWIFLDNAGGSQVLRAVADRVRDYLLSTSVQLGATYDASRRASERVQEGVRAAATLIGADPGEVVLGPSATQLLANLARAMEEQLGPGDEVVVTNADHEANISPWLRLRERSVRGIEVKVWRINPETLDFDLADLDALMTPRTRLVCFSQATNILGTIQPVEEITRFIHARGAKACVDGVAYAPHRLVDVRAWDVDFYVVSLYKVFGPHLGLLYGKREHLLELSNINHLYIGRDAIPYKLQPGNLNYELAYGLPAIVEYLEELGRRAGGDGETRDLLAAAFDAIARHEAETVAPLLDCLAATPGVRVLGKTDPAPEGRVATVSFVAEGRKSSEIPTRLDEHRIGVRYGDFHARRLIQDLGYADRNGVVRISLGHYNTAAEIAYLCEALG